MGVAGVFSKNDSFAKGFSLLEVVLKGHNKLKK
jgi:hypothetical protein